MWVYRSERLTKEAEMYNRFYELKGVEEEHGTYQLLKSYLTTQDKETERATDCGRPSSSITVSLALLRKKNRYPL